MAGSKLSLNGNSREIARVLSGIVIAHALVVTFRDPAATAADSPLDQPVSLQLRYASVAELCKGLTTDHVSFVPATPEIGDYKVHALLRDTRLRDAMTGVTQLFSLPDRPPGLYWRKEAGRERPTYQLAARPDFARRLAEARQKPWEQLRQRLALLRDWSRLSPEQRKAAAEQHPVVARQAGLAWDPTLVQLFWSNPQAATLLRGDAAAVGQRDRVTLRYRDATPELQRLLAGLRESFLTNSTGVPSRRPEGALEDTLLEFRVLPDTPEVLWRLQLANGRAFLGDLGSPRLRLPSGNLVDSPDAFPTFRSGWSGDPATAREVRIGDEGAADPGAKIDYLFQALQAIQSSDRVNFLAHARTVPATPYALPASGSLETRLDGVGKQYLYRFSRSGPLVLGEDTRWALDHETEVPLRLLLDWANRKQKQGRLDVDELAEMTQVSKEQWTRLRLTFPELKGVSRWLGVWATLSPAQRRAAWSPTGLVLKQVPDLEVDAGAILRVEYSASTSQAGKPPSAQIPEAVVFSVEGPKAGGRRTESSPLPPADPQFRAEEIRK